MVCKIFHKLVIVLFLLTTLILITHPKIFASSENLVHIIQLDDDTVNPVTAQFIMQSIDRAYQENAQCLIIKLDTPGGLLNSTRSIVKKILTAQVPVVVYISPSGSRAGSAGVFLTLASHIAAMAPSTNIGAAHPVQLGDPQPDKNHDWRQFIKNLKGKTDLQANPSPTSDNFSKENESTGHEVQSIDQPQNEKNDLNDDHPMQNKILNDTVAFIKAIAQERQRNVDWAIESVTQSASITETEALGKKVIEIIANDDQDLLQQLDGRTVEINNTDVVLQTKNSLIHRYQMDARQIFFNILADPNITYFLLILGFYGLLYEITHPGFGLPGILGAIFLILAFYSLQTLPTNYAGLAFMALGLILFITEALTPTFGLLTLGGLICLILGSLLLFESTDPVMRVSFSLIISFSITTAVITIFLIRLVLKTSQSKVKTGEQGLIGEIGQVRNTITPGTKGKIFVHGELWNAISDQKIEKEEEVSVIAISGLTLKVEKKGG